MKCNRLLVSICVMAMLLLIVAEGGAYASAYGDVNGSSFGSRAEFASVYATVVSAKAVRIDWPQYAYAGYAYVVQAKIDEGGFYSVCELSRTITAYEYGEISAASTYVFRVLLREYGTGREEAYFNEIVYKPSGYMMTPINVSLEQVSPSETRVSWGYADGGAYETVIERLRGGETAFAYAASAAAGVNSYTDAAVDANTLYRYRIKARYGYAVYSDYAEASVRSAIETPQITEVCAVSPSSVYISWTASSDAARYQLERRQKGDMEYSVVTSVVKDRGYYTDYGVVPGERYFYRVKAISQNRSESLYSDEAEVTAVYIDMAQVVSAVAVGDYRVELSWPDLGDKESTYEIWRSDAQYTGWKLLAVTERNATGYVDAKVGPGDRYAYKIRARSAVYDSVSAFSAETYAETVFINAPSNLRQARRGAGSIDLYWDDNSANESRFIIERRGGSAGQWVQAATAAANETAKTGLTAPANAAWYFRVGAYSSDHRSVAYSEPILADNGYQFSIRGSAYYDEAAGGGGSGGNSNGGGSGSAMGKTASSEGWELDSAAIKTLGKYGIVKVVNGTIAGGGENITRGEFIAMLARALGTGGAANGSFADVKPGHIFYKEIMQAARLGFVRPDDANMVYPDRLLTRAEMISFVYDSLIATGSPLPTHGATALRPFADAADVPPGLTEQARSVFGEGIMIGIGTAEGGRIIGCAYDSTRAQSALVIYRLIRWLDT